MCLGYPKIKVLNHLPPAICPRCWPLSILTSFGYGRGSLGGICVGSKLWFVEGIRLKSWWICRGIFNILLYKWLKTGLDWIGFCARFWRVPQFLMIMTLQESWKVLFCFPHQEKAAIRRSCRVYRVHLYSNAKVLNISYYVHLYTVCAFFFSLLVRTWN